MDKVHTITNKLLNTNTYFYIDDFNCIIIDPGSDYDRIRSYIYANKLVVIAILATHGHFDHVASVAKLKEEFGVDFYLHSKDSKTLKLANFIMKMFGFSRRIEIPSVDYFIDGLNGTLKVQNYSVEYLNTPGHTHGSCIFKIKNNIFTGDTLFYLDSESKIPNENLSELASSQSQIFDHFNDDALFWPGHNKGGQLKDIKKHSLDNKHD
jgi:glyoxylase-like metal-dependent hydrolase (beta-lactamase superfamily II)